MRRLIPDVLNMKMALIIFVNLVFFFWYLLLFIYLLSFCFNFKLCFVYYNHLNERILNIAIKLHDITQNWVGATLEEEEVAYLKWW